MHTSNIDRFYTLLTFDASFLSSVYDLSSLTVCVGYNFQDFRDIYSFIFHLPVLKYIKLSSEAYEPFIPLSMAPGNQFSSIEYLIINHSCLYFGMLYRI